MVAMFGLGVPELIIIFFLFLLPLTLLIIALIDILRSTFKDSTNKIIWVLVVIFVPFLGAILYFIIGRSQKVRA